MKYLLHEIGVVRSRNVEIYAQLASLTDAKAIGFQPRVGQQDVTLRLIEQALTDAPEQACELLDQIADNDEEVVVLTRRLTQELGK